MYEIGSDGKPLFTLPLGLAIGSPDVRRNAPCLDGHTVYAQYFTSSIVEWITSLTSNGQKKILNSILKKIGKEESLKRFF